MKEKSKSKNKFKKESPLKWALTITVIAFFLSMFFAYFSNTAISKLEVLPGIVVLILVILLGILFDLIGVAVTIAKEEEFHAKASKKIKGAKTAIKLIRNSAKVSNICNDVVGDICGVISGAIGTMIALKLSESFGIGTYIQFILSAIIAALTIGGKAITKEFAKKNATKILSIITKGVHFGE